MNHSGMKGTDHSRMEGMHHSQMGSLGAKDAAEKPVDPVWGMEIGATSATKATMGGKTYSFCSEADKTTFLNGPSTYLKH